MKRTLKRVERKILVYNKMKSKGLSYEQACKELESELNFLNKQEELKRKNKKNPDFKKDFEKLRQAQ